MMVMMMWLYGYDDEGYGDDSDDRCDGSVDFHDGESTKDSDGSITIQ